MASRQFPNNLQGVRENLASLNELASGKNTSINQFKDALLRKIAQIKNLIRQKIDELKKRSGNAGELIQQLRDELARVNDELERTKGENENLKQEKEELLNKIKQTEEEIVNINQNIDQIKTLVAQIDPDSQEINGLLSDIEQILTSDNPGSGSGSGSGSSDLGSDNPEIAMPPPGIGQPIQPSGQSRWPWARGGKKSRKSRMIKCRTRKQMRRCGQKGGFIAIFDQKPSSPTGYLSAEKSKSKDKHRSKKHHKKHDRKQDLVFAKQPVQK